MSKPTDTINNDHELITEAQMAVNLALQMVKDVHAKVKDLLLCEILVDMVNPLLATDNKLQGIEHILYIKTQEQKEDCKKRN